MKDINMSVSQRSDRTSPKGLSQGDGGTYIYIYRYLVPQATIQIFKFQHCRTSPVPVCARSTSERWIGSEGADVILVLTVVIADTALSRPSIIFRIHWTIPKSCQYLTPLPTKGSSSRTVEREVNWGYVYGHGVESSRISQQYRSFTVRFFFFRAWEWLCYCFLCLDG